MLCCPYLFAHDAWHSGVPVWEMSHTSEIDVSDSVLASQAEHYTQVKA